MEVEMKTDAYTKSEEASGVLSAIIPVSFSEVNILFKYLE